MLVTIIVEVMKFHLKQLFVFCIVGLGVMACTAAPNPSASVTNEPNVKVAPKSAVTISQQQLKSEFLIEVADWLKVGVEDPFGANIQLTYDSSGAYAGTMRFKTPVQNNLKPQFDVAFYNQFIGCLANDLSAANNASSWLYIGLHAEENTDPQKERDFFIVLRNQQSIQSIQKRYMLPAIDEQSFHKTGDPLYKGEYCAAYKSNLTD